MKNYYLVLRSFIILVITIVITLLVSCNNKSSIDTKAPTTTDAKKLNEESLNATIRDFNNAFRSCNPSNCASYFKEQNMRDKYSKNLSGMFDEYGCPQKSEMSEIKITSLSETSAEITFRWVWFCNFEKESRFYRSGVYAGPFTNGNRLMQASFEKGSPGWQLTKMKAIEKGKDERSWALSEWKRMR